MQTKQIWCNMIVEDLERTARFYTALGFKPNGRSDDLVSFRIADNDFIIHFFARDRFDADFFGQISNLKHGKEVVFSLAAKNKEEVAAWEKMVNNAGGTVIKEAQPYKEGHVCVFSDPDGHTYNVLYWPGM